jgi:polar amino acid transport system substrate-binding protein
MAAMLKFAILTAAIALISYAPLTAAEPGWTRVRERLAAGVLRWGGDAEGGAPFQLRDPQDPGHVIGFEVELAAALADTLSRHLQRPLVAQFVQYEWVSLPLGLEKGDFDIILSGFEITDDRRGPILFSRPYYVYAQQLVARSDEQRFTTLDDCGDKLVGTLAGSAADRLLRRRGIIPVAYDGQIEPYLDLELGRLDAVLLDTPIVTFYAETNPHLKLVGEHVAPGEYGIAAQRVDDDLIAAINVVLGELMESGVLRQILRRWHLWNADQAGLAREPRKAAERRGLGFSAGGQPLHDGLVVEAVDRNMIAASAQQWTFTQYAPLLLRAAGMTVLLTVSSMVVAMLLGLVVAVSRLYLPAPGRWLALAYVEFFRGIPLLLLLFFLYFGAAPLLARIGLQLSAVMVAVLGFGLNYAAYESEIYRSSILAVPRRQWEAAQALGMSDLLCFRRIILPQAIRTALGPMTNDFVALFKDTSLVSVIAVRELTKEYLILSRSSLKFVELGLLTAALYLAMSVPLGYLSRYLEHRWGGRQA